ncbi:uncharacterized protein LOC107369474 [Tetranychus urticae]|uniref:Uncharacterized protein n=1 Tax=Tetranychus urticae TaxID=32264 RepID=T1JQI1_TETUR|nr:uncharacterized protein LOC107369474 [Tetranychus urticae]
MSNIVYIGKPSRYHGKQIFEILTNLKNFGIGRILERRLPNAKYPEKTFCIIKEAYPQMDEKLAFGLVYCEHYYRGARIPGLTEILTTLPDYRLVPKHEEEAYLEIAKNAPVYGKDVPRKVLPQYYKVPPLMAEVINRRKFNDPPCIYIKGLTKQDYGYDSESLTQLKIPYVYKWGQFDSLVYKVADEDAGEKVPSKPRIFIDRLKPKDVAQ